MTNETSAQRLGRLVRARRKSLKLTQAAVQELGGPSTATQRLIEGGKHTDFRGGTGASLEAALEWAPGSIDRTLAGGEPTQLSDDAGAFLSKLRHPYQSKLVAEAIDGDDKDLVAAIEEVLETGQVSPNAHVQLQRLRDDSTIKNFPKVFEVLSRGGKLKVARYGQEVRTEELHQQGGSNVMETASESATSPEGDEDEEVVRASGPEPPASASEARRRDAAQEIDDRLRRGARARSGQRGQNPPSFGQ